MKNFFSGLIFIFLLVSNFSFAIEIPETDKKHYNGEILERVREGNKITEIRYMKMKNVETGDRMSGVNTIYDNYINRKEIGEFSFYHYKYIDIYRICSIYYLTDNNEINYKNNESWIEISTRTQKGWLRCDYANFLMRFKNFGGDNYDYIETIKDGDRKWTVRKLKQVVSVNTNLNIRDKPGLNGKKIGLIEVKPTTDLFERNHFVDAITEEIDSIDGIRDHWLKIGKGWIFGGYADIERGGPKYETIEAELEFILGDEA